MAQAAVAGISALLTSAFLKCSIALVILGALCAAAGIGGGGIIVSVLMNFGELSPHDAIPLSKAVVFLGSLVSLALNKRREMQAQELDQTEKRNLINWQILKLIVPMSLIGTLLGVALNRHTPGFVIVLILTIVLAGMTIMVFEKAWKQYKEESRSAEASHSGAVPQSAGPSESQSLLKEPQKDVLSVDSHSKLRHSDFVLMPFMLCVIIFGGILRHRAEVCHQEKDTMRNGGAPVALEDSLCSNSMLGTIFGNSVHSLMGDTSTANQIELAMLLTPTLVCLFVAMYYAHNAVKYHKWSVQSVLVYQIVACMAGMLAGLVGIGGGLIFSPFFLIYGVEPSVAVATSATCVLFTSSSTTVQYLFTNRIIVSLALAYGAANAVASLIGTSLVHQVQDRFAGRRSYVSLIIAAAVAISTGLAAAKMIEEWQRPSGPVG